jgi:hypothetical protein
MQATQAPPRLPGVRAATILRVNVIVFGAVLLPMWALLIGFGMFVASLAGGHLPWPVAQWALTTPAGVLVTLASGVCIAAPSFIAAQRRVLRRWQLARAVDVTEVPPWVWLTRPPVYPGETRADRWLGRRRRARTASLMLLSGTALLLLLVSAGFLASAVASLRFLSPGPCGTRGCPPQYPLLQIVLASEAVTLGLAFVAQYRWLRRVEASSGVWLRYRDWFNTRGLCYIRQPGVTPEAAKAALARVAPAEAMPLARVVATSMLAALPLFLLIIAGFFLQFWLPTQWIPG